MEPPLSRRCAILLIFQKLIRPQGSARTIQAVARHFISDARGLNGQDMRPTEASAPAEAIQPLAIIRARIGLRMNNAIATTVIFIIAVSKNTRCQLPVDALIMLATGTRKAEVPFAV
jgi:hypothetical protein